jgi:hypothetical protein
MRLGESAVAAILGRAVWRLLAVIAGAIALRHAIGTVIVENDGMIIVIPEQLAED